MDIIDELQPADKPEVALYLPYYQKDKHNLLPLAINLYKQGFLEGARKIEGGEDIEFVATWYVSNLPSELTRCRIQFDGNADLNYETTMINSEFIDYLIDLIANFKSLRALDFPGAFYRKLLRLDESTN